MIRKVKKTFEIQVTNANQSINKSFELEKGTLTVLGVMADSDKDDLLYYRGSQKIEINKIEYFPENYASKRLMSSLSVGPNDRYHKLDGAIAGNRIIQIAFRDLDDGRTVFEPYKVTYTFNCEMEYNQ